jgi:hypothetical protein
MLLSKADLEVRCDTLFRDKDFARKESIMWYQMEER